MTTLTVPGEALHVGDIYVDPATGPHVIDHVYAYPAMVLGDSAHRLRFTDGTRATVLDHHLYAREA